MKFEIKICKNCNIFTLEDKCKLCKDKTSSPKPPRYSPVDKYGEYRRKYKKLLEENG